jgi:lipopolysaccharide transport system ATP-binding protein
MSDDIAIRVQGLSKCYRVYDKPQDRLKQSLWRGRRQYFREFWALRDISFDIRKGETVGIIGRNGSGKSTLLQLIAGTLAPTTGTVQVNGRVAALLELGSGFNPEFTGRENVYMNGAILGLSEQEISARFDEIAAFAAIGDFIERPVKTYSSGMMMRLAFAVSVCVDPDVLIVDEALSVGDIAFQLKCMDRLDRLVKSGTTLLFVSHDILSVKSFCQRAIYLTSGQMVASGPASDIAERYMMDVRNEQKLFQEQATAFVPKKALGDQMAVAFGTVQGHVLAAYFSESRSTVSAFATGDTITLTVEVEFDDSVTHPAVSVIVSDIRMIEYSGHFVNIARKPVEGMQHAVVEFSFNARLNTGEYFLAVRLEQRTAENIFYPVDKQVGALRFQVMRPPSRRFLGLMEMDFSARQID